MRSFIYFVEAYLRLTAFRAGLAMSVMGSFHMSPRLIDGPPRSDPGRLAADPARPAALARAVARAARRQPGRSTCLARSLTLQRMLIARGYAARLRLGVRRPSAATDLAHEPAWQQAGLAAHAWIEVDGQVVGDDAAAVAAFEPFERPANVVWD